jgi:hypothetical protein
MVLLWKVEVRAAHPGATTEIVPFLADSFFALRRAARLKAMPFPNDLRDRR